LLAARKLLACRLRCRAHALLAACRLRRRALRQRAAQHLGGARVVFSIEPVQLLLHLLALLRLS
jgi:hypothetical protein